MTKDDVLQFDGIITQARGNGNFLVKLETGTNVSCVLSGKIRQNGIKMLEGDKVKIEVSVYDITKGRITRRLRSNEENI